MNSTEPETFNPFIPNKYMFVIEGINDVTFNMTTGSVPGLTVGAVAAPYGANSGVVSGDRIATEEVSLTFTLDEGFKTYKTAYAWLTESVTKDVSKDVTIILHTAQNTKNVSVRLVRAIPTGLSAIELTTIDEGIEPISITLSLACDRIEFL
tara:strand:- start:22966 stop:23421 length:456 start_codon:yes stop_codon:yes gene_type:complete